MDAARRKRIQAAMVRLSDGDRNAFEVLLDELWPVVLSFAQRGVGRGPDAEDIAQEVFFKVCSRIADFDRHRDAVSWAFGIASYEVLTHRRRVQRRREVYDESSVVTEAHGAVSQEEQLLAKEVAVAFEQAVAALTDDDRTSLGLQGAGASEITGATQRKRKQRALHRLRGLWRHLYDEP